MFMTRLDWWMGIAVLTSVLSWHALIPRYDVRIHEDGFVRIDRWTGHVDAGVSRALPWVTLVTPR